MRRHITNAAYGVFDYASFPLGMLLVAPIILHKIGAAEYGLWMVATAVISAGGIIASGFCDATALDAATAVAVAPTLDAKSQVSLSVRAMCPNPSLAIRFT